MSKINETPTNPPKKDEVKKKRTSRPTKRAGCKDYDLRVNYHPASDKGYNTRKMVTEIIALRDAPVELLASEMFRQYARRDVLVTHVEAFEIYWEPVHVIDHKNEGLEIDGKLIPFSKAARGFTKSEKAASPEIVRIEEHVMVPVSNIERKKHDANTNTKSTASTQSTDGKKNQNLNVKKVTPTTTRYVRFIPGGGDMSLTNEQVKTLQKMGLTPNNVYSVIAETANGYRVQGDHGKPAMIKYIHATSATKGLRDIEDPNRPWDSIPATSGDNKKSGFDLGEWDNQPYADGSSMKIKKG